MFTAPDCATGDTGDGAAGCCARLMRLLRQGDGREVQFGPAHGVEVVGEGAEGDRTDDLADLAVAVAGGPDRAEADRLSAIPAPLRDALDALDALDEADIAGMLRGTTAMIRVLQQQQAIPVSRTWVTCRLYRPDAHPDDAGRPHHCAFVDAPFGDGGLRLECPDHQPGQPAGGPLP